ncbi:MAG TPA: NAD(P)/FAD-dependent oxidoreductase [Rhodanobacteraceae bacterium]|nr:NAD(P)/FAD-dependent oxidoreductase [Rhodanobacteraceae bacterium]
MNATSATAPAGVAENCDVLVIGGGPGGSTVATLLARRGWSVIGLEKERHPRFHIGESLLPMNLPIFERLGVMDKVRALGKYKAGADFEADNERGYNTFDFCRALGSSPPHAFEVYRQEFDQMLFEHARENGADMRDGERVTQVEHEDSRQHVATVRGADGEYTIRARYVIDASGRDAFLAGRKKLKRKNRKHQTAALFGHFTGAEFRDGEHAGNVSLYRFGQNGWAWLIPLRNEVMSVGVVAGPDHFKQRRGDTNAFFFDMLKSNAAMWKRLENASLIDERVQATGNYSYDARRIGGPGWLLVGDAFGFLDPVFSSGVLLAMSGAEHAADVVDTALRQPRREAAMQRRLEKRLRTGMKRFSFFIYRFNNPVMARLFRNPRNVCRIEQGIISMLAGDVFDNRDVLRRLTMFRTIYGINSLLDFRTWFGEWRERRRQARAAYVD